MHDCPNCRVPLHGHEEVCPSCGAAQYVRSGFRNFTDVQKEPSVNFMPFVVVIVVVGFGIFMAAQSTWIGGMMKAGPRPVDPLEKLSFMDARNIIEQKITEGLTAVGAKGKFNWQTADGTPADRNSPQDIQLAVETKLQDPNSRRSIIDPIKAYMEKAKIPTLTMTDAKSHATWTYTVQTSHANPADYQLPSFDSLKQEENHQAAPAAEQPASSPQQQYQQQYQQPVQQQPAAQPAQPAQQPVQQQPAQPPQEAMPWDQPQQGSP